MAKVSVPHVCSACQATSVRWFGRCPKCQEYGTIAEAPAPSVMVGLKSRISNDAPTRPARAVRDVSLTETTRQLTGLGEFDRALGGGLVAGQVVLLAGEPGVGKSTLLLAVAHHVAASGTVLYISGEESAEQIALRAKRIGADARRLLVADETELGQVLAHINATNPDLLIVDSVQTIAATEVEGRAGGVAQVHEVTQVLTRVAKARRMPLLLIGQSTKDNAVAGPRALEHLVDTVLTFEGDQHSALRMLRATKNRFGPANEVVCFEQGERGLQEVPDPSAMFRMIREHPVAGTCVTVTMEGRRAMLAEIQALVNGDSMPPRRTVTGLDYSRAAMLVAVTDEKGLSTKHMAKRDVFLATVAGVRVADPAADLAVCLSLASAALNEPMQPDVLAIGEVALSGDIRPVSAIDLRVNEAIRLGYRRILVPGNVPARVTKDAQVMPVVHLGAAVAALRRFAGKK